MRPSSSPLTRDETLVALSAGSDEKIPWDPLLPAGDPTGDPSGKEPGITNKKDTPRVICGLQPKVFWLLIGPGSSRRRRQHWRWSRRWHRGREGAIRQQCDIGTARVVSKQVCSSQERHAKRGCLSSRLIDCLSSTTSAGTSTGTSIGTSFGTSSTPTTTPTITPTATPTTTTTTLGASPPLPSFLNNQTIPTLGYAFQGFSDYSYMGEATKVIREEGFLDLSFNCTSYVWIPNQHRLLHHFLRQRNVG